MIPLKDNIPARRLPAVNAGLILVNVLVFILELQLGPGLDDFIRAYGFVPVRFMAAQSENFLDLDRFMPVYSSMFLHGGFLHLLSNMWMLWIFGDNVEDSMGHRRYLLFYLLCGTVSVLAQAMASPASPVPLVGASGAIAGVLGAYFLLYPRARILAVVPIFFFFYMIELPAFVFLGLWILLQIMQGYTTYMTAAEGSGAGGIAWWAHIGGFAAGLLLINLFKERLKGRG
ncbi:MAG: rhomboid family intramembrane serine protease [Desulfobulbales bacterium]|nr:rhomboid family intramembrane serine protease [Desulfobulbales bacterium]